MKEQEEERRRKGTIKQLNKHLIRNLFPFLMTGDANDSFGLDGEIYRSMTFVLVLNVFNTVTSLPFSVYNTFVLEEK